MTVIPNLVLFLPGLMVAWVIGANDAANSMGTAVGSKVRTVRQGVILVGVFGLLGALLLGGRVAHTLAGGIVPLSALSLSQSGPAAFSAMTAAGICVIVCTWLGIPVSTSHAVVGGLIGSAVAGGFINLIVWEKVLKILGAWILTPCVSAGISYIVRSSAEFFFSSVSGKGYARPDKVLPVPVVKGLLTLTGCFMAFNWGANDVANATGMLSGVVEIPLTKLSIFAGLAMCCGVFICGKRVMITVGEKITRLSPLSALIAEMAAALTVNLFTMAGLPVSTTHAVIGAVGGVGFSRAGNNIDFTVLANIVLTWFLTPVTAGGLSTFIYILVTRVF